MAASILIGETVTKIELGRYHSEDVLVFFTESGKRIMLVTYGDCCSSTYIYELTGVDLLIGHEVLSIEDKSMDGYELDDKYTYVSPYSCEFKTAKGYFSIVYRNESNGYYGGSLMKYREPYEEIENLVEVTADFLSGNPEN